MFRIASYPNQGYGDLISKSGRRTSLIFRYVSPLPSPYLLTDGFLNLKLLTNNPFNSKTKTLHFGFSAGMMSKGRIKSKKEV
ncbi:hypothetical protein COLO4_24629 [Corchorus olitorius]|uniref:Uncharacterized protein n=1 Tax=Corchorus olitorius TaxID=93759 RepID=A0A1R3I8L8_9ROSI|nr:hypothetical protein COLO4_24629 [Corchorus olitorius]